MRLSLNGLAIVVCAAACGGREPQSADCQRFVACVRALDAQDSRTTNVVRFEPAGGWWGGSVGAKLCTESCGRGLAYLRRAASVPMACAEGRTP